MIRKPLVPTPDLVPLEISFSITLVSPGRFDFIGAWIEDSVWRLLLESVFMVTLVVPWLSPGRSGAEGEHNWVVWEVSLRRVRWYVVYLCQNRLHVFRGCLIAEILIRS